MRIDPVSLQMLVAVAETGNIAAAAEREHIATSALSRRLSELEHRLGAVLLNRSNKGVTLTAAGSALVRLARNVLTDLDEIYLQMQDFAGGRRGYVRLAATPSAVIQFLPAQLATFAEKFPEIQIQIKEDASANIPKAVAESVVDAGVFVVGLHDPVHRSPLEIIPYQVDEQVVITPPKHLLARKKAVSFQETLDYSYVIMDLGNSVHSLTTRAAEINNTLKVRVRVTSYHALCIMVEAGFGVAVLPRGCAESYTGSHAFRVLKLAEPWAQRQIAICVRDRDALPAAARLLVSHLRGVKELA
jgi:DNA-binding transcriptional LysR family regulator